MIVIFHFRSLAILRGLSEAPRVKPHDDVLCTCAVDIDTVVCKL